MVVAVATARQRYTASRLAEKYGVVGRVASRYIYAGYSVRLLHPTRHGSVHIIAKKYGSVLAIDVVTDNPSVDVAKSLLEKSKLLRARPVLVLYGNKLPAPQELVSFCEENNIKLKRVLGD
jgi:hypothetical protein